MFGLCCLKIFVLKLSIAFSIFFCLFGGNEPADKVERIPRSRDFLLSCWAPNCSSTKNRNGEIPQCLIREDVCAKLPSNLKSSSHGVAVGDPSLTSQQRMLFPSQEAGKVKRISHSRDFLLSCWAPNCSSTKNLNGEIPQYLIRKDVCTKLPSNLKSSPYRVAVGEPSLTSQQRMLFPSQKELFNRSSAPRSTISKVTSTTVSPSFTSVSSDTVTLATIIPSPSSVLSKYYPSNTSSSSIPSSNIPSSNILSSNIPSSNIASSKIPSLSKTSSSSLHSCPPYTTSNSFYLPE